MKNIFFGLVLLCLPISLLSQAKSIERFYEKYKGLEEVTSINITGELIQFVFTNADPETEELASKISKVRVLVVEEGAIIQNNDYKQLIKSVKKDNFQELMRLKDGGEAVDIHLREDGDVITDVLITVYGEDGLVLLSLEGLFNFSDLNDFNLDIEGAEHLKKLPDDKKKLKRA